MNTLAITSARESLAAKNKLKKSKNINKLNLAIFLALGSVNLAAKEFSGKVENAAGMSVGGAKIEVRGTQISTIADENGNFTLDLPIGDYTFDVKAGIDGHFHQKVSVVEQMPSPLVLSLESGSEGKLVVRANPLEHTTLNMATPSIIIAGDELVLKRSSSLGEILKYEPGLSVSSFGPSVSRPVIRGLGASRVMITDNQMVVQDASTTSADHDIAIEPLLADQVEVVKGPATLLYGSGAVGGVVNVVNRKITDDNLPSVSGGVEVRLGDSATGEQSLIATLDGGSDLWNWHVDAYSKSADEIEIPVEAESEALRLSEGEEGGKGEAAILENSQSESSGGSFGLTYMPDWGYWGVSVSTTEKLYGVPGHAHHEEEHEEGTEEVHEEEHEEGVAIDMEQTRFDTQLQVNDPLKGFSALFVGYALTDYNHVELEGDEIGTQFDNEAWEFRSYLKHEKIGGWHGIVGVQITERDFVALGEEAFVPPSVTKNQAVFVLEEKQVGNLKIELGARYETQSVKISDTPEVDQSGLSLSFGNVYELSDQNIVAVNFSRAQRFASVEELFSDGPHIATQSFEIGNENLEEETSNNLDLSYRFKNGALSGEVNLYWNQFNDYIHGRFALETDSCVSAEAALEAAEEELRLVCYDQQDADFKGAEVDLTYRFTPINDHSFSLNFIADTVSAEFDDESKVPLIPAQKIGLGFNYDFDLLSAGITWLTYSDKSAIADNEIPTEGYDMLDFDLSYRIPLKGNELMLFFKGQNLLDEEARDHSSYVKDLAPRVGRNFLLGARYIF